MKFTPIIVLVMAFCIPWGTTAQSRKEKRLLEGQRKQFELNNYYISMNINAMLTGYSGLIELKLDSIMSNETSAQLRSKQLFLKSTLLNSLAQASFHSDPLAAAIDSWSFCYQLIDYFESSECMEVYGDACPAMHKVFTRLATNYENGLSEYLTDEDKQGMRNFATNNPIMDEYLNRRSIIYDISKWISSNQLGIKTGLISMTDLMRDLSNQLEYYSATLPKQTMWQMDMRLGALQSDSILTLMTDMQRLLNASAHLMEQAEEIIGDNRDTLLANLDYQRRMTMYYIRQERIETLEALTSERIATLNSMREERIALQQFMSEQREFVTEDMASGTDALINQTSTFTKDLIDYIFIRILVLGGLFTAVVFLGLWIYKKY